MHSFALTQLGSRAALSAEVNTYAAMSLLQMTQSRYSDARPPEQPANAARPDPLLEITLCHQLIPPPTSGIRCLT